MAWLVFEFIVFSFLAGLFGWTTWLQMPNRYNKKTKAKRSLYQRWKLTNRSLRAQFIIGICCGLTAVLTLARMVETLLQSA